MANNGELTSRQKRMIAAILESENIGKACTAAGVGRSTLARWMKLPVFSKALSEAESTAMIEGSRRLAGGSKKMVTRILKMIDDEYINDATMLRVIQVYSDLLFKFRDQGTIETRLQALEKKERIT